MNRDSLPTASTPCPTDNVEVLSQKAPSRGEVVLGAPRGDLPDPGRQGSKTPTGSKFGPQPNTAPEPLVVLNSSRRPPIKRGKSTYASGLCPSRGTGQLAGSASRRFHRRRAPHYHECGDRESSVRQKLTNQSLCQPPNRLSGKQSKYRKILPHRQ